MRAVLFLLTALFFMAAAQPCLAQDLFTQPGQKPEATSPQYIAMIFYKYSHQAPDYDAWARASDEYKNAPDFAKEATMQRLSDQLSHVFGLISPSEEILADYPVTLSDYSFDNKGYFIDNLKSDMFIPFSYNGENFAVVPKNIMDEQWLAVDGMPAKEIDDLRQKSPSRKDVTLTFSLLPKFASKDGTLTFDGKPYRLISAEIRSLSIYDAKGMLVWQQGAASSVSGHQTEILNLYQ